MRRKWCMLSTMVVFPLPFGPSKTMMPSGRMEKSISISWIPMPDRMPSKPLSERYWGFMRWLLSEVVVQYGLFVRRPKQVEFVNEARGDGLAVELSPSFQLLFEGAQPGDTLCAHVRHRDHGLVDLHVGRALLVGEPGEGCLVHPGDVFFPQGVDDPHVVAFLHALKERRIG